MNLLDRIIAGISPEAGLRRARARLAADTIKSYEAGSVGRRFGGLKDRPTSANAEIQRSLPRMRNRHRALVRDNPWAAAAVRAIVTNTVAYGITGEVFSGGKPDKRLTDRWLSWCEPTTADASGGHNFYGAQALGLQTTVEAGEVIIRRRWRRPTDRLPLPFQIELVEPDYLDHSKNANLPNGGRVVQGIEYDAIGRVTQYWMFRDHPGDSLARSTQSYPVPARDIIHMFRQDRPQQARGVPWGAAAMLTLYDLDGFEDAFLFRQKLANCFMGVEESTEFGDNSESTTLDDLEPGIIYRPKTGRQLKFTSPPMAAEYPGYVDRVLYRVAAAYGVSYQALTGNLEKVNFSSGRMGWLDFQRNIEQWRWNMLIPQMCERVGQWFLEAAELAGERIPEDVRFEWSPPRREMIDPSREVSPLRDAIRSGITSLPAVHREYGEHTARILAEIAATNEEIDKLGLVLDTDPRKVSGAGLTQARPDGTKIPSPDIDTGDATDDD